MSKRLPGFGLVMLVVVLAVVLVLVARSWRAVAPTAIQVSSPELAGSVHDHGESRAAAELRSGQLPNLGDMRQNTSAHADEVQRALDGLGAPEAEDDEATDFDEAIMPTLTVPELPQSTARSYAGRARGTLAAVPLLHGGRRRNASMDNVGLALFGLRSVPLRLLPVSRTSAASMARNTISLTWARCCSSRYSISMVSGRPNTRTSTSR